MEVPQEEQDYGSDLVTGDEQHELESRPVIKEKDVRTRRQSRLPRYLADYDLTGATQRPLLAQARPPSPFDPDPDSATGSQLPYQPFPAIPMSARQQRVSSEYEPELEDSKGRPELVSSLLSELDRAKWQYTEERHQALLVERENRELRSHMNQLPETVRKLQKLEREALQERVRHLEKTSQTVHGTPRNIPSSRGSYYSADIGQNPDPYFVADLRERLGRA